VLVHAHVIMLSIATFAVSSWTRLGGFDKWLRKGEQPPRSLIPGSRDRSIRR